MSFHGKMMWNSHSVMFFWLLPQAGDLKYELHEIYTLYINIYIFICMQLYRICMGFAWFLCFFKRPQQKKAYNSHPQIHWGCGSLVLKWSFVLGPAAGRATEPSGRLLVKTLWRLLSTRCFWERPLVGMQNLPYFFIKFTAPWTALLFFLGGPFFCVVEVMGKIWKTVEEHPGKEYEEFV